MVIFRRSEIPFTTSFVYYIHANSFVHFPISLQGEDEATFSYPVEAGEDVEGIITLRSPIHGVAAYDIMVCMSNAKKMFLVLFLFT